MCTLLGRKINCFIKYVISIGTVEVSWKHVTEHYMYISDGMWTRGLLKDGTKYIGSWIEETISD